MRLLILTQNYLPEPDPKMHVLAKSLQQRGYSVSVLTGFPNYPSGRIYPGYRQNLWRREVMDGVEILRVPLYPDHSRSAIRRALNYISFAVTAAVLGPLLCAKADLMLVYHPPTTLAVPAWVISKLRGIPFVYEIQDMWPDTLPATGMLRNRMILGLLEGLGRFIYRRAKYITVISPGFKRRLVASGIDPAKVKFFPNWAYEGIPDIAPRDEEFDARLGLAGKINIVYAGNMGPAQALDNIIDAAEHLADAPAVQFVLVGRGVDFERLSRRARDSGLGNVRVLPGIPMTEMPKLYAAAAAVMVHLSDEPLFDITIPGKTQSSLASGRPVIACVRGDAADMIRDAGAGFVVPPMQPRALADAVRKLVALEPAERESLGAAGRHYYMENLHPEQGIRRYDELFRPGQREMMGAL